MNIRRFSIPTAVLVFALTASAQPTLKKVMVTINITGIAHLKTDASPWTLIVPNHHRFLAPDHRLFLLVDSDAFGTTQLLDKARNRTFAGTTTRYKYREFPDGYQVDLVASGWFNASPRLDYTENGDKDKPNAGDPFLDCPSAGNRTSLHWLPRLSTLSGMTLTVKPSHSDKNPNSGDVLAWIEMPDGKLETGVRLNASKFEFVLAGPNNNHVQAVADTLSYTFPVYMKTTDTYFVLIGRKFNKVTGSAEMYQELARVAPVGDAVELTLANVIEDEFFNPQVMHAIPHFSDYYDIISGSKVIPGVRFVEACNGSGGDAGVECGPDRVP